MVFVREQAVFKRSCMISQRWAKSRSRTSASLYTRQSLQVRIVLRSEHGNQTLVYGCSGRQIAYNGTFDMASALWDFSIQDWIILVHFYPKIEIIFDLSDVGLDNTSNMKERHNRFFCNFSTSSVCQRPSLSWPVIRSVKPHDAAEGQ